MVMRDLADAYAACSRMARDHYENFPVASFLLPRAMRPHVAAVYAFARVADDFADEGDRSIDERLALLDAWHERLSSAVEGAGFAAGAEAAAGAEPSAGAKAPAYVRLAEADGGSAPAYVRLAAADGRGVADAARAHHANAQSVASALPAETDEIFTALAATIGECRLPASLFEQLLSAFRQDVTVKSYKTWDDVLDYCRRSANPVGRLVLGIGGYSGAALEQSSDALCTALQLTNFWQDLARDRLKGRLYLPLDACARAGANLADLDGHRLTPAWRSVLADATVRTADLFEQGRAVCDGVRGRLRLELRLTWLGGRRILSRLQESDFDMFQHRPTLGAADVAALSWQALTWRAA
jgi:squalene synthase HpnC